LEVTARRELVLKSRSLRPALDFCARKYLEAEPEEIRAGYSMPGIYFVLQPTIQACLTRSNAEICAPCRNSNLDISVSVVWDLLRTSRWRTALTTRGDIQIYQWKEAVPVC